MTATRLWKTPHPWKSVPSYGFPPLLGKAFGFPTLPTGRTTDKTLNSQREF